MNKMWRQWMRTLGRVICPEALPDMVTVIVNSTAHSTIERLDNSVELIMTMTGRVEETGEIAQVKVTLSDPNSLRELTALLATLVTWRDHS